MNKKRFKKYLTQYQQGGCPEGSMWNPSLQKCVPYEDSFLNPPEAPMNYFQTPKEIEDEIRQEQLTEDPELLTMEDLNPPNNWAEQGKEDLDSWRPKEKNSEGNNGITIPDYTYDLPSAATYLGESIEDKNALGIIGSSAKLLTGLGRNVVSGAGLANRRKQSEDEMRRQQQISASGANNMYYAKEGGKITLPQELTGDYVGEEQMMMPNSELEGGEFKQDNQGNVQEVVGETHENGGVEMNLEEGEKILSDHLKIGGDFAKELRDNLEVKVKATDTYSDVMDKLTKASGLKKITKEQEEVIEKLSKLETEDEDTRKVNETFLKNKINELEQKKQPLLQDKKMAFEVLFEKQEASKQQKEKEEFFRDGGVMDTVTQMSKDFDLPLEDTKDLYLEEYKKGGMHLPKYQDGGDKEGFQWDKLKSALKNSNNLGDFLNQISKIAGDYYDKQPGAEEQLKDLIETLTQNKTEVSLDEDDKGSLFDLVQKTAGDTKSFGDFITAFSKAYGKKWEELFYEDNKDKPEKINLKDLADPQGIASRGRRERDKLPVNTLDGYEIVWNEEEQRDEIVPIKKDINQTGTVNLDLSEDDVYDKSLQGTQNLFNSLEKTNEGNYFPGQKENTTDPKKPTDGDLVPPPTTEDEAKSRNITFPTQFRLPPTGVQPHWMPNRTFDRVDPQQVSETPYFEQSNKMTDAQIRAIKDLPPSQRAVALASISASQSDSNAKFAAEVGRTNAGFIQQADQVNAQTQRMEENAGVQDALSFERRQLGALDNTQQSIRNYFEALGQDQLMKAQQTGQIELLNDMYGDVDYTGSGVEQTTDANKLFENFSPEQVKLLAEQELEKKKKQKKKYGGRFKKYKK